MAYRHIYRSDFSNAMRLSKKLLDVCFMLGLAISFILPAIAADKKQDSWEEIVKRGNVYFERDRTPDARRYYQMALKILIKLNAKDIRKAIVLHNIAETYRREQNYYEARMDDLQSSEIYKQEINNHQLGREYSSKKPISIEAGSLRPACYLCHENWKVVPILYGESTGYVGEPPAESEWKFTHKPGGKEISDQRWYCRDCHQAF